MAIKMRSLAVCIAIQASLYFVGICAFWLLEFLLHASASDHTHLLFCLSVGIPVTNEVLSAYLRAGGNNAGGFRTTILITFLITIIVASPYALWGFSPSYAVDLAIMSLVFVLPTWFSYRRPD